jgi:L-ascorbate metabolism protein UlaG (beta-lactamase superfamily)
MNIKWIAHAAFLITAGQHRIITDPYSPDVLGLPPVDENANLIIRSSSDDQAHCRSDLIAGAPTVVTATEITDKSTTVRGIRIAAIAAQESKAFLSSPRCNAMFKFRLDGITIAHFGDIGNELSDAQIKFLRNVDVALVPTGGPPTIELPHLYSACRKLRFPVVIPMHYAIPGARPRMLPVKAFTDMFRSNEVEWIEGPIVEFQRSTLPLTTRIFVVSHAFKSHA